MSMHTLKKNLGRNLTTNEIGSYSMKQNSLRAQNIDFDKLDFENAIFSPDITQIPYKSVNENIALSLLVDDKCNITFMIEYLPSLDDVWYDDYLILDVNLPQEKELQLFKLLYWYNI